ncbi:general odorant-binding protein 45-like [Sabethes cyaneus]|uniref:general odorant-binding protein 45-like n=1 Tax=Sabethes cyaneus TaxID=53552 RepID=UPI00237DE136|nr:general odorant-binding protein 45-like [Sabethes cyaneus]
MTSFIALLIVTVVTVASGQQYRPLPPDVEESQFAYQLKSFRNSLDECAEYLEIPKESVQQLVANNYVTQDKELKCLVRCAGINSGWWNETSGVQGPVMESYFQPGADDACYERRTRECIAAKLAVCQNDCSKAYESFLCYYHQWGNLKCGEQYIPLTPLEQTQVAIDCINILRTPRNLLEQYSAGVVPDVPETRCLYRCLYIAEGVYDPALGFNLPRLYVRKYQIPAPEILSDKTKQCIDAALKGSCDECSRVFQAKNCFSLYGVPNSTAIVLKNAADILLGQSPSCPAPPPPSNPRYNYNK